MASSFKDFLLGPHVTFFIGRKGTFILVHGGAIAATGEHFTRSINRIVENPFVDCATIKDVEVDDFVRFCEYAYRGDYTVPSYEVDTTTDEPPATEPPIEVPPIEEPPIEEPPTGKPQQNGFDPWEVTTQKSKKVANWWEDPAVEAVPLDHDPQLVEEPIEDDRWGKSRISSGKKKKKKGRKDDYYAEPEPIPPPESPVAEPEPIPPAESPVSEPEPLINNPSIGSSFASRTLLRTRFKQRMSETRYQTKLLVLQSFEPKPNNASDQNFTPVFLAHARLYSFAHVRLIEPLKALTLDKLHETLLNFKLYKQRVPDVVALAKFVYTTADLPGRDADGNIDEMRRLVIEYIICEIDAIGNDEAFLALMADGGEFVGDFWRMTKEYVV